MLIHTKDVRAFKLDALDGELGKVKEFYFDDAKWMVRYLVADTGRWIPGREVLISPVVLQEVDEDNKTIMVNLTKETIKNSPSIVSDRPVSRQDEIMLTTYYGWPHYWEKVTREAKSDPFLRSTKEVIGYTVEATDGEAGKIVNFILDDVDWNMRYLVADTKTFMPWKKVLLALEWITEIDETKKKVKVDVSKDMIQSAPEYDPDHAIERDFETKIFDHYNKAYYWR